MRSVVVSAPGKLMLLGEHAVVYDRPCIVTAIDRRMKVRLSVIKDEVLEVESPKVGIVHYRKLMRDLGMETNGHKVKFVELGVKHFREKFPFGGGVRIETLSEFSCNFGFGSSATITVCVIKALAELFGKKLSNKEIFDLAYKTVLAVQGRGSGFDVASAVFGGTLYFWTGGEVIERLTFGHLPLVIGYTGIKADTVSLIKQVEELRKKDYGKVEGIFDEISVLVKKAKEAIVRSDWKQLGDLMNRDEELLEKLGVGGEKLSLLIKTSLQAGAFGAKLSGAGVGDCMVVLVPEEKKNDVCRAISQAGGEVVEVELGVEGVRIEVQSSERKVQRLYEKIKGDGSGAVKYSIY